MLTVAYPGLVNTILDEIVRGAELSSTGKGTAFVLPVERVVGVAHFMTGGTDGR